MSDDSQQQSRKRRFVELGTRAAASRKSNFQAFEAAVEAATTRAHPKYAGKPYQQALVNVFIIFFDVRSFFETRTFERFRKAMER